MTTDLDTILPLRDLGICVSMGTRGLNAEDSLKLPQAHQIKSAMAAPVRLWPVLYSGGRSEVRPGLLILPASFLPHALCIVLQHPNSD